MILHFARALAVREQATSSSKNSTRALLPPTAVRTAPHALRMRRDPSDARRTVITGRFADVCAALDRMVAELEPAA